MSNSIRVTVWNEYRHEKKDPNVAKIYPKGVHRAIAKHHKETVSPLLVFSRSVS